jgi:hypothetical protein
MCFRIKGAPAGRLMIVSALAIVLTAPSMAQRTFVRPHVLEKSGTISAILWDQGGGQSSIEFEGEVSRRVLVPIEGVVSPYGNDQLFAWLVSNINGKPTTENFNLYSVEKGARNLISLEKCSPGSIRIPACDVDSKEARGIEVSIMPGSISNSGPFDGTASKIDAKKQKMWLPSNFRLSVGNLPCSRVSKIDSFTIKQGLNGDLDGDGNADIASEVGDLSFLVPMSDAPVFQKAMQQEFPYRHEMLDDDGNTLFTVTGTVIITSAELDDICLSPTDPSAMLRVTAHHHRGHVTVLK